MIATHPELLRVFSTIAKILAFIEDNYEAEIG